MSNDGELVDWRKRIGDKGEVELYFYAKKKQKFLKRGKEIVGKKRTTSRKNLDIYIYSGSVSTIDQVTVQLRLRWNITSMEGKETKWHR